VKVARSVLLQWNLRFDRNGRLMRNRYLVRRDSTCSMAKKSLSKNEIESVKAHSKDHPMTLALIRTEHAPSELGHLLAGLARACGVKLLRSSWTPSSDFGFAELNSNTRILVVLWVGGARTELVSVSEIDEDRLLDMENEVFTSNFQSTSIKDGL